MTYDGLEYEKGLKIQTGCALNEWRGKKKREEKDGRKEGVVVVDELTFFSTSFRV